MRRLLIGFVAAFALLSVISAAYAAIPDPDQSSVVLLDDCWVYCPASDQDLNNLIVTVRNAAGDPLAGILATDFTVDLDGMAATATPADTATNAAGELQFDLVQTAGSCDTYTITVMVYTITLSDTPVVETRDVDLDHNGCVAGGDGAIFGLQWATAGPCADFDCSGIVAGGDGAIFGLHWSHGCK